MANVLSQFLVGIGWDTSDFDKGTRNIERSMGGVKSSAGQLGAALVGAFGAKALTTDFARRTDQLNQFADMAGVSADKIQALAGAFDIAGGSGDTAFAVIDKLTKARDALAVKGEAGFLTDAAFSGIDPALIRDATDGYDALLNIVGEFDKLSPARQRTLAETLGVGPSEIQLFKSGRDALENQLETLRRMRPATSEAEEAARNLRSEWATFAIQAGGIADQISTPLVGALGEMTQSVNEFIEANRPMIDGTVGKGVKIAEENFGGLALAVGGLTAAGTLGTIAKLSQYIPGIGKGLGMIATNLGRVSAIGAAAGTASVVAGAADSTLRENLTGYESLDAKFTRFIYDATGFDVSRDNVNTGTERQSLNPWADVETPYGRAVEQSREEQRQWLKDLTSRESSSTMSSDYSRPRNYPPVQVTLEMDKRVISEIVVDVNERTATSTLEDLVTTTSR